MPLRGRNAPIKKNAHLPPPRKPIKKKTFQQVGDRLVEVFLTTFITTPALSLRCQEWLGIS